ncbi:NVEALA domain-containing protein [Macellibacteroides fermentans]|uniref:NVEALA domain-containing protein n=1 Tax=Macellibacteroides fermentans TaxID=879969 RepID=UPI00406C92B5
MKKYIVIILLILMVLVVCQYFFFIKKNSNLSDVEILNIDALATCESTCEICWMDYNNWKCCDVGYSGCAISSTY